MKFVLAEEFSNQPSGTLFYPMSTEFGELKLGALQMLHPAPSEDGFYARQLGMGILDQVRPAVAYRDYPVRWHTSPNDRFLVLDAVDVLALISQLTAPTQYHQTVDHLPVPTVDELRR